MSLSIDTAFVQQFESEVHMAYQRMGSKLGNTTRMKSGLTGKQTTFQKVGKGTASTKSRHGNVPTMSIDHTQVVCTVADYYAADYIDDLDEIKINHDERMVVAKSAAAALGRRTDLLITTALDATTNTVTEAGTDGLTQAKINTVFNYFGNNDVPDDGERFFAISPVAWTNMLGINAFSNADYVGSDDLPYKGGMVARRWMGFMFFTHSGLEKSGNIRQNYAWHKSSVGHAVGSDVHTKFDWVPEKAAHLHNSYMSQGAVIIDATGTYEVQSYEAP